MTLEQFRNFNIVDTHGIVISERFFYDFVRSYKINISAVFQARWKKKTHGEACADSSVSWSRSKLLSHVSQVSLSPLWPIPFTCDMRVRVSLFFLFILNTNLIAITVTGMCSDTKKRYGKKTRRKNDRLEYDDTSLQPISFTCEVANCRDEWVLLCIVNCCL